MNDHALLINKDRFSEFSVSFDFLTLAVGETFFEVKKDQAISYQFENSYYKIKNPLADCSM